MTDIERLSRAVATAWGYDPDKQHVLNGGIVGKLWQADRINDVVTAFLAMQQAQKLYPMTDEP